MNPYSFIDPVDDPRMFYGFHDELNTIVSKVSAPRNERQSFFVSGAWRMGKTSLMLQIERRLHTLGSERQIDGVSQVLVPIYLDVMKIGESTPKGFFGRIGSLLASYLKINSLSFSIPTDLQTNLESVATTNDPLTTFEESLRELARVAHPRQLRIVLLLDELGRMLHRDEDISLNLRALHVSIDYVLAYVITGSYLDLEGIRATGSPLENILIIKKLRVFDKKQSFALINEPIRGQVTTEVADQVFEQSGGHPFLLQYLMYKLCEQGNLQELRSEDVLRATETFLHERRDFEHWWEKLREIDKTVYRVFYRRKKGITIDELGRMFLSMPSPSGDGRKIVFDSVMIQGALRVLETTGLIRETSSGVYESAGEWFATWYRRVAESIH